MHHRRGGGREKKEGEPKRLSFGRENECSQPLGERENRKDSVLDGKMGVGSPWGGLGGVPPNPQFDLTADGPLKRGSADFPCIIASASQGRPASQPDTRTAGQPAIQSPSHKSKSFKQPAEQPHKR